MALLCDAVFEGGGVKGIGLVGAVTAMEEAGYTFAHLAGSSAGAIVSALLAVGYTSGEIRAELDKLDYTRFQQEGFLDRLGPLGKSLSLGLNFGIYSADYFEGWMAELLRRKGKETFGHIRTGMGQGRYDYRFHAIASDLSDRKMLVLPGALLDFGIDPDAYPIAKAVRMSMSIPLYFEPFFLRDAAGREHLIVDGGLLSNYPIWLLDDGSEALLRPTFGFKFDDDGKGPCGTETCQIKTIADYGVALLKTMLDAHDSYHISTSGGDLARTILISTQVQEGGAREKISATDFDLTQAESRALFQNGYRAAQRFLFDWDFEDWKRRYRPGDAFPPAL